MWPSWKGPPEPQTQLPPLQAAAFRLSTAGLNVSLPEIWLAASVWATGHLQAMWEAWVACGYWLALGIFCYAI